LLVVVWVRKSCSPQLDLRTSLYDPLTSHRHWPEWPSYAIPLELLEVEPRNAGRVVIIFLDRRTCKGRDICRRKKYSVFASRCAMELIRWALLQTLKIGSSGR
jgi:hypothetical protein